jgi:hypothetical protein
VGIAEENIVAVLFTTHRYFGDTLRIFVEEILTIADLLERENPLLLRFYYE